MDFHFLVIEKSQKVIVEKEWAPCAKCTSEISNGIKRCLKSSALINAELKPKTRPKLSFKM